MATNVQFSIAVHVMAALGTRVGEETTTGQLAGTVNTSASFVRRVVAKLSRAGLVETTTGQGGACRLRREPGEITLLEIYRAVEGPKVFAVHAYPAQAKCVVSSNIKRALGRVQAAAQRATEESLKGVRLQEVIDDLKK